MHIARGKEKSNKIKANTCLKVHAFQEIFYIKKRIEKNRKRNEKQNVLLHLGRPAIAGFFEHMS
jgi:hypothetical protein